MRNTSRRAPILGLALLVTLFLFASAQLSARAVPILGLTNSNKLVLFESTRPETILFTVNITGLKSDEQVLGIDVRPATGELYAVTSGSRLYRVNPSTGVATQVGLSTFSPALNVTPQSGFEIGFDFDPVQDLARVVANGQSLRVSPSSGAVVAVDSPLFNTSTGEDAGHSPSVDAIAYSNNFKGAMTTTLYAIDWRLDRLVTVGSEQGSPVSPNTGEVFTVNRLLGFRPFLMETTGFDIAPGTSALAYAAVRGADATASRLLVVELKGGRGFEVGFVGGINSGLFLRGLAVLPPRSNIYAVTESNRLISFNAAVPGAILSSKPITGLQTGEQIVGIDFRQTDARLYALGSTGRLYRIDIATGAATPFSPPQLSTPLQGTAFGFSITPLRDGLHVVSDADQNLSAQFFSGGGMSSTQSNPALNFAPGDPNAGQNPKVTALAQTIDPGPGVLTFIFYGIDSDRDVLVSSDTLVADGRLKTVGPLSVATANDAVSLDIDIFDTGTTYASLSPICFEGCPAPSALFIMDLATGRASLAGWIGGGELVRAIAIGPRATVEFVRTRQSIVENCTSAQLLVMHTGGSAFSPTVDYATGGGTFNVPPADERADYEAAYGTLRFGVGESVKAIPLLVNEDSHAEKATTGHDAEPLLVTLSNPSQGTALGEQATTTLEIHDDGDQPGAPNAIDDTANFVCQHYHDFLNRDPDAAGLAFWTNNIESCGTNAACREVKRIDTSAAFFLSIEFQQSGYFVHRTYQAGFGRAGVPLTFIEFLRDMSAVREGVIIGEPGALERLEANKRAYIERFAARADFINSFFPPPLGAAQYVDTLNARAGNPLTTPERDALVAGLQNGQESLATILRKVVEHPNFRASELSRGFVLTEYFGYLRRNPSDAPDADLSGFNFWLNKLNSFGGNYHQAEMVKAFITSTEYRRRFGAP